MKKVAELRQELAQLIAQQRQVVEPAQAETRSLTADEQTKFDAFQTQITEKKSELQRAVDFEENQRSLADNPNSGQRSFMAPATTDTGDGEAREKRQVYKNVSLVRALNAAGKREAFTGAEKEFHEIGVQESRDAGLQDDSAISANLSIPMSFFESRASQQTVTQDSGAYGGALVQNAPPTIVDPLRPRLWLENIGATFLTGLKGNVPLVLDADFDMEWLAEGASVTVQKKQYAGPTLTPKRAAGAVSITNQLLMQSSPDVERMIQNGIYKGFQKLMSTTALNGATGGNNPVGILNYTGILASAQTSGADATYAAIVELQGLIEANDATEMSLAYIMHPTLKAALKQITKDAGSGRFLLEGDALDGYKYVATSLMPTLSSGTLFPLIFGDFAQLYLGQWGSINIKVNPYSEDVADSVRLTLNTHADVKIPNPKAFAKNAYLTV